MLYSLGINPRLLQWAAMKMQVIAQDIREMLLNLTKVLAPIFRAF